MAATRCPGFNRVINVVQERLDAVLGKEFADYVLANDIVEHVHHWSAVDLLGQFFQVLKPGGGRRYAYPTASTSSRAIAGRSRKS